MVKPLPPWFRPALLAVAAIALFAPFTREISDFDFWWTLKSGQYIAETHRLPVPDPFAFTTPMSHDAYAGESVVRRFNLTFVVGASNILNIVNLGTPNGVLLSPLFNKTQTLAGGQFGSPVPGTRSIIFQSNFSF